MKAVGTINDAQIDRVIAGALVDFIESTGTDDGNDMILIDRADLTQWALRRGLNLSHAAVENWPEIKGEFST